MQRSSRGTKVQLQIHLRCTRTWPEFGRSTDVDPSWDTWTGKRETVGRRVSGAFVCRLFLKTICGQTWSLWRSGARSVKSERSSGLVSGSEADLWAAGRADISGLFVMLTLQQHQDQADTNGKTDPLGIVCACKWRVPLCSPEFFKHHVAVPNASDQPLLAWLMS